MPQRSVDEAEKAVAVATDTVVKQGDIIQESALWDATEAALDGQPRQYLADIISGKVEGPYKPKGRWTSR